MSKQTDLINIPDAITVDGSNNVGIGASPSSSSTVKIQNTNDNSHNTLDLFNDNGNRTFTFQQDSTGNAKVILQKNDGTNAVRLDANLGGILFGTDTAAANALNDYEEGTWTPVPTFGGSTAGIAASVSGSYTKIGRQVNLYWTCTFTNLGSATGEVSLGGVPFTSTNISHINSGFSYIHRLTLSSLTQLAASLDGGNEIKFRIAGVNTGNASNLTSSNLHYTSAIHGAISYQTNS
jgi:hypothetical protein